MALSGRQSFTKMQATEEIDSSVPRQGATGYQPPTDWHSGLCDCLNDAGICVWGFCCLPCQFGENTGLFYAKSKDDGGECLLACCLYMGCFPFNCCIGGLFRRDLRQKYHLKAEPCGDCFVHMCCFPCAVCQEAREIKYRGQPYTLGL